jgi:hypothetical protein
LVIIDVFSEEKVNGKDWQWSELKNAVKLTHITCSGLTMLRRKKII